MEINKIIQELSVNREVFSNLLSGVEKEIYTWRSKPEKWCLLEIVCHLYDEEREDFRYRAKHILETPTELFPDLKPENWPAERNYMNRNYSEMLQNFLDERGKSLDWLRTLTDAPWTNEYSHPKFGYMTAKTFLANWLAHDYLHIKQITRLKYDYLEQNSGENVNYAGEWK